MAVVGAHLVNASTTDYAFREARRRGLEPREANPVMRPVSGSTLAIYASRGAAGALVAAVSHKLATSGRRKRAKLLVAAGIIIPLSASAWDLTRGRRTP